ncbi:MAG: flagellar motor switch protein FliM [Acidobacteriota bacterium]
MSEVLSQDEIDALLSALNKGEVNAEELKQERTKKKVRVYDFRRPNKFSKDQLHTLQVIYENYARSLGTYLSAQLRAPVNIDVLSVEQLTYDEFIRSIPNPTILCIFSLPPLEGNAIFEVNPNLGFAMLDRLFGGPGLPSERVRSLTEIEETVMERVSQRMLTYLEDPWASIVPIQPFLERIDTNPQFTQIVSPSEMVVIVSLETKLGEVLGMINICIPFLVLEPVIGKLSVHYYYSSTVKSRSQGNIDVIKNRLQDTVIPLKVVLGKTVITVKDLLDLNVGDVIPLERSVQSPLEVIIGHKTKYLVTPGVSGNKVSVQVIKVIEGGDDENE